MNTLQLYVNDERVELFSDETINVTSSIQNAKDISKIFTDFSKDFTVPATAQNNKIFKHYYNYDIVDGFDARLRQDALLQINHATFRKGKVALMGVNMKNNNPSSYKIVFYGSTVTLPDLFGDDVLPDILELNDYNHEYSPQQVKTGLETSLIDGNIIYPLITHSKRLYYNSTIYTPTIDVVDTKKVTGTGRPNQKISAYYTGTFIGSTIVDSQGYYTVDYVTEVPDANLVEVKGFGQDGNLNYNTEQPEQGLEYTDLKPALKINKIVDAIERKYGITFSSTFFESNFFDRLFMWLHRKKGALRVADGETFTDDIKNFVRSEDSTLSVNLMEDGQTLKFQTFWLGYYGNTIEATFTLVPESDRTYSLRIYDKNELIKELKDFSGEYTETFTYTGVEDSHSLTVQIETSNGLTNYDATWNVRETTPSRDGGVLTDRRGIYEAENQTLLSRLNITDNIPDMKVLDFMTNLFKMFNLTSYVKDDGTIYVETLDTFYSQYKIHDITNYVFTDESTINRALPYNKINLEFPEPKTFIAEKTNQITGRKTRFGNLIYDGGEKFDGTDYTLKVDFEKMVYERLSDSSEFTNIAYGWFAKYNGDSSNDISNASPEIGKPLIFFNVKTVTSQHPISWISGNHSSITTYNRPSNVSNPDSEHQLDRSFTLNFGTEIDEFVLSSNSNSIYDVFYRSYIERVFNAKGRMFTFKAKLPQRVLLNYELNDVFIINGKQYVINSIDTDLMTGISNLQLINKLSESVATNLGSGGLTSNDLLFDDLNLIS